VRKSSSILLTSIILSSSQLSYADVTPMSALDMDRVTAGTAESLSASGGAVVGNDSSAVITSVGTVTLDSEAQEAAKALNIVNSSESTVANGLNIWDGQINADLGNSEDRVIEQSNTISQDQRRVASLPNYNRPEANVEETWNNTGSSSSSSSHNEVNNVTDLSTTSNAMTTDNVTSVDALSTILGQQIQAGKGLALAGQVDAFIDGGEFNITLGGDIGGALSAEITLSLELPEITLSAEASGCAAMNGSCDANGHTDRLDQTLEDHSTAYSLDTTSTSSEQYTEMGTTLTRSAFQIEGALAEYIVVDNSTLDVKTDYSVNLSGAAQAGLNALNVVNAAGSAVANGVNIGRSDSSTQLAMTQSNVIVHSR
jgi:hypothetical protein